MKTHRMPSDVCVMPPPVLPESEEGFEVTESASSEAIEALKAYQAQVRLALENLQRGARRQSR